MIGFAKQLPGQMSVDVTFLRRNYKERYALIEQNGIYDGVVFKGYKNEALNDIFQITNNTYNWFVYTGLEISVAKRAKNMQIIGGYTRGWQHLAGTWQPHDPASFIQPDAFPNDAGLGSWRGNVTSSLNYNADTRSYSWLPHILRIAGSYNFPYRLTAAASLSVMSGSYLVARLHDDRRGRPGVRAGDRDAVERPEGHQPAVNDVPLRVSDPGRGPASDADGRSAEPQGVEGLQIRRAGTDARNGRLQRDEQGCRPAVQ